MNFKNLILPVLILISYIFYGQENKEFSSIQADYYYGNILGFNKSVTHLIKGHPTGIILGWNKETYGKNDWEERFNYPDMGVSFVSQDFKNRDLGKGYGLYGHYNFYFGDRKKNKNEFFLRFGFGITYITNPYDKVYNSKNIAFGSHFNSSAYTMLNYKRNLFKNIDLTTGINFIHSSNGNTIAPNNGVNIYSINLGINYNFYDSEVKEYIHREKTIYKEPVKYNFAFRTGYNEAEIVNAGTYPFFTGSFYADKRLSHLSSIQLGTDVFFSLFLKEYIKYNNAINNLQEDPYHYTRLGLFAGHELFINRISFITQIGFYIYDPVNYEKVVYERAGLKYYFGDKLFGSLSVKAHAARAESIEFGIGVRL